MQKISSWVKIGCVVLVICAVASMGGLVAVQLAAVRAGQTPTPLNVLTATATSAAMFRLSATPAPDGPIRPSVTSLTFSPLETHPPEPTAMPTATSTATLVVSEVKIKSNANLRSGPSTDFGIIGTLQSGAMVRVEGKNAAGTWYKLERGGWVFGELLDGQPQTVAVVTVAPTATPDIRATQIIQMTAEIASYRAAMPAGTWCERENDIVVCVYRFRYFYSTGIWRAGGGMKFVGFGIEVQNHGRSLIHANPYNVTLVDSDGRTYSHDPTTYSYWTTPLEGVDVRPGNYAAGGIVFHIRDTAAPAQVIVTTGLFEPTVTVDLRRRPDSP